ncbi:DNA topoisomerase [Tirmania nivea]|nr:DNA topoisomerase [Tirmania nivea]
MFVINSQVFVDTGTYLVDKSIHNTVAGHLSGGKVTVRNTGQKYIKNYNFTFRFPASLGGECHATMSSVVGHTGSCRPEVLFDSMMVKFVDEARRSTHLYIWTDCDREGEYIGIEIRDLALKVNSRLIIKRARFNNIERAHVIEAAMHPVNIDELQASAIAARIELDLRIGAAFTKYWRVVKFMPEKFWSLRLVLEKDGKQVDFSWREGSLFDKGVVIILYKRCLLGARKVRVEAVKRKATRKSKPLPLTTVELQKQGSRYLSLSSQVAMTVAEKLYTSGFISYPCTETDIFDPAIDLRTLIQKQTTHPTWGPYASSLLNNDKYRPPRKGTHNDKAHPPIHPVVMADPTALNSNKRKVYEFVYALGESTMIDISWGTWPPAERFSAGGLLVKERNYLDVEGEEIEPETRIREGQTCRPGFLTEPELIGLIDLNGIGTDATMAEHIAKIVEREYVFAQLRSGGGRGGGRGRGRGAGRCGQGGRGGRGGGAVAARSGAGGGIQEFVPSTLGIALVTGYDQMSFPPEVPPLTKPFLRKEMEVKMKAICEGRLRKEDVVRESLDMYRGVFAVASREVGKLMESCNRFIVEGDGQGE